MCFDTHSQAKSYSCRPYNEEFELPQLNVGDRYAMVTVSTQSTTSASPLTILFYSNYGTPVPEEGLFPSGSVYLGDTLTVTLAVICVILSLLATILNHFVIRYYWPLVQTTIGFIYFILSSSDFATGICAGLHALVFLALLTLHHTGLSPLSFVFVILVPSYFLSVVAFKVSAFVSMVFAIIRTLRIVFPLTSSINKTAVVSSVGLWCLVWAAIFLTELVMFFRTSTGWNIEDIQTFALTSYFYHPNRPMFIQILLTEFGVGYISPGDKGACLIDLLYIALPVFLCAGLTLLATIVQVWVLLHGDSAGISDPEADRQEKRRLSVTIILIGLVFITCSSCTLYQPLLVCATGSPGIDYEVYYVMGYLPFFVNAVVNPLILIIRVQKVRDFVLGRASLQVPTIQNVGRAHGCKTEPTHLNSTPLATRRQ